VVVERRLEGGARILMGGFDTVVADWNPEMEDPEARDGRRTDPADFLATFGTAAVVLASAKSGWESENDSETYTRNEP